MGGKAGAVRPGPRMGAVELVNESGLDREAVRERAEMEERLAALAHEQWSGWMDYLFAKCWETGTDDHRRPMPGDVVIPAEHARRWKRQKQAPYADLPEGEKESDRVEARKVLAVVSARLEASEAEVGRLREEKQCEFDIASGYHRQVERLRDENERYIKVLGTIAAAYRWPARGWLEKLGRAVGGTDAHRRLPVVVRLAAEALAAPPDEGRGEG